MRAVHAHRDHCEYDQRVRKRSEVGRAQRTDPALDPETDEDTGKLVKLQPAMIRWRVDGVPQDADVWHQFRPWFSSGIFDRVGHCLDMVGVVYAHDVIGTAAHFRRRAILNMRIIYIMLNKCIEPRLLEVATLTAVVSKAAHL
jgi:hypothetical protein